MIINRFKGRKKIIFLVDDDELFLKSIAFEINGNQKYEIYKFTTAEEMFKNLAINPAVIVLDYHLNSDMRNAMNGLEALKILKNEKKSTAEIIMVSIEDKIEVVVNCMKYGAFDYFYKSESSSYKIQNAIKNITDKEHLASEASHFKSIIILIVVMALVIIAGLLLLLFFTPF